MKLVLLSLALVAAIAITEARPRARSFLKKSLMLAGPTKKAFDGVEMEDLLQKIDDGFSSGELGELASIATNVLGEDVDVDDVQNFLNEFDDLLIATLTDAAEEFEAGDLQKFEDALSSDDLESILDEIFAGDKKKKSLSKKSLQGLIDTFEAGDYASIAEDVSDILGYDVSADDVEAFIDENGADVEQALLDAASSLDKEHFKELEQVLEDPDMLKEVLDNLGVTKKRSFLKKALAKKGMGKKKGFLPKLDQEDFEAIATFISLAIMEDVTADDVKDVLNEYGDVLEAAFKAEMANKSPEEIQAVVDYLSNDDNLANVLIEFVNNL